MPFSPPPKITAAQLREVARLCGIATSGTKAAIADRIGRELSAFGGPLPPGTRVLSIDLGIRNLAYSLFSVPGGGAGAPAPAGSGRGRKKKKRSSPPPPPALAPVVPTLLAWDRLALMARPPRKKKKTASQKKPKAKKGADGSVEPEPEPEPAPAPAPEAEAEPEDFSPAHLAATAVKLVRNGVLPLKPDIITLEAQRFRSMGGAAVFEWTLRVNSLESMLYAILTTLHHLGHWNGVLRPIPPRHVVGFLEDRIQEADPEAAEAEAEAEAEAPPAPPARRRGRRSEKGSSSTVDANDGHEVVVEEEEGEEDTVTTKKKTKKKADSPYVRNKKLKMGIVGRMLQGGTDLRLADDGDGAGPARATAEAFLQEWRRKPGARRNGPQATANKGGPPGLDKIDDLADCLLQGLAFIRWQENKDRLLHGGVDAIRDLMRA